MITHTHPLTIVNLGENYPYPNTTLIPPESSEILMSVENVKVPLGCTAIVQLSHDYALRGLIMMPFILVGGFDNKVSLPVYWPIKTHEIIIKDNEAVAQVYYNAPVNPIKVTKGANNGK